MDGLEQKIIELLMVHEKLKAKEIAKQLNITKKEVNQCLYYRLGDICAKDVFNFWRLKGTITLPFKSLLVISKKESCVKAHTLKQVKVKIEIVGITGKIYKEETSVKYCSECDVYFITPLEYKRLRELGVLLCRVVSAEIYETEAQIITKNDELNTESLLHQYGYNVMASNPLKDVQRQEILKRIVANDIYTKRQLISFLNWLIDKNCTKKGMKEALEKWESDRKFVSML